MVPSISSPVVEEARTLAVAVFQVFVSASTLYRLGNRKSITPLKKPVPLILKGSLKE